MKIESNPGNDSTEVFVQYNVERDEYVTVSIKIELSSSV